MNFRPTPGPRLVQKNSNRIVTGGGVTVALCFTSNEHDKRLLAYAPEMMRLLQPAILSEKDTWDGPHKEGSLYSEPKWLTESRVLVTKIRARR